MAQIETLRRKSKFPCESLGSHSEISQQVVAQEDAIETVRIVHLINSPICEPFFVSIIHLKQISNS
jgi:hypothetical protein